VKSLYEQSAFFRCLLSLEFEARLFTWGTWYSAGDSNLFKGRNLW